MSDSMPQPIPLKKVKTHAAPHPPLVKMLEGMLESAKKVELQAVACACVYASDLEPGGGVSSGWQCAPFTRYAMAFAMSELNHEVPRMFHED